MDLTERKRTGARRLRQVGQAEEKREKRDVAKGDAVAGGWQGFERERRSVESERGTKVLFEFGARVA